jgi:xanthine dehydrogenase molybdopterin-binding subunit B
MTGGFWSGKGVTSTTSIGPVRLHGVVLRSPHRHALIGGIEAATARAMSGVRGVFTAADLDKDGVGPLPCIAQIVTVAPIIVPARRALARDRGRHVGDPVAFVVAATREEARDAAERGWSAAFRSRGRSIANAAAQAFHQLACHNSPEGIVSKRVDGRYEPDRGSRSNA